MEDLDIINLIEQRRQESKKEHDLLHERVSNMKDEIMAQLKEMRQDQEVINKEMEKRVTALERWKWSLIGGAAVLMFFIMGGQDLISNLLK